ncbi:acyltransferase family protein [Pinibacter aurantiacus]|uniref:Acyltransferase n=1 Tax=Pinibacter aurantiacus TaxID=2851599 RepID=A0A9E2S437_9BACT|nr:acyltransferase [Pinibacter aurantiacus]MBV4356168.1 acyltransferase [Pinibacter aurantiacus]
MNKYKSISFFEGLNPLRFFAALLVLMHHSEAIKLKNGLANLEWLGLFRNGNNAVTFFFVLSGFLITYLLLKENFKTGTISIKTFYIKRMLRIWPLYFLLVVIGAILLPVAFHVLKVDYTMPYTFRQTWYYFLFFLPGLVTFFFGHHLLEPLWSIGVEEVFYLIWAPLFKCLKHRILVVLLFVIAVKILLTLLSMYAIHSELFAYVVSIFQFESMAIGGLGAYFLFYHGEKLQQLALFKKPVQVLVYFTLAMYLIFHANIDNAIWNIIFKTPVISALFINFLFLYLILDVSSVDSGILKIKSKLLSTFGEISYGIYMYHMLVIFTIILFLKKYLAQMNPVLSNIVFYLVVIPAVLLVSYLSKKYFENYFLSLKEKLEKRSNQSKLEKAS